MNLSGMGWVWDGMNLIVEAHSVKRSDRGPPLGKRVNILSKVRLPFQCRHLAAQEYFKAVWEHSSYSSVWPEAK
jgi:hypothetical protein